MHNTRDSNLLGPTTTSSYISCFKLWFFLCIVLPICAAAMSGAVLGQSVILGAGKSTGFTYRKAYKASRAGVVYIMTEIAHCQGWHQAGNRLQCIRVRIGEKLCVWFDGDHKSLEKLSKDVHIDLPKIQRGHETDKIALLRISTRRKVRRGIHNNARSFLPFQKKWGRPCRFEWSMMHLSEGQWSKGIL